MPKSGVEILVLTSIWGTAKVRAHAGEIPVILWTNTENVSQ
ncbi:MAG: hypothetical protein O7G88_03735 [bacterium]|nr:hypothetical protein [bacterium]